MREKGVMLGLPVFTDSEEGIIWFSLDLKVVRAEIVKTGVESGAIMCSRRAAEEKGSC